MRWVGLLALQVRFVDGERLCKVHLGSAAEAAIEAAGASKFVRLVAKSKAEPLLELVEELWLQMLGDEHAPVDELEVEEELEEEEEEEEEDDEWNVGTPPDHLIVDDEEIRLNPTVRRIGVSRSPRLGNKATRLLSANWRGRATGEQQPHDAN
jgi:hypothetical protein